jgi:hypothetical protein
MQQADVKTVKISIYVEYTIEHEASEFAVFFCKTVRAAWILSIRGSTSFPLTQYIGTRRVPSKFPQISAKPREFSQ